MPSYNLTIDDVSPQWKYVGLWMTDNSRDGTYTRYDDGKTFHATSVPCANATLAFNGTAITVYSSKRDSHVSLVPVVARPRVFPTSSVNLGLIPCTCG